MNPEDKFVEDFLSHEYDPVKAREYYLRTRELKGRKVGKGVTKVADPRSNRTYDGKPLKPLGKRIEEDETPDVSPTGAKLVDYDGGGLGKGTYADGSVYDPRVGWTRGNTPAAVKKVSQPAVKMNPRRRIGAAEQKLIRAKTLASKVKDPKARADLLKRLSVTEKKLKAAQAKHSPTARKGP